ncbi:uncharacterized protein SETTUDRAFT_24811 [Exserohilum turcica Et28A]|uniref:Uncharacterized protein n=1 Tax=Exserohilum turcicum (strain 28A) TaxID=671987 RepID=R0KCQ5_EXST2|nr:uncharacterized protein SETTUDRAFT_24811 [Exserohilum turcica Et28A]EOA90673.1 hypothetical protein SETTUDRAFT_24811 [Exserohilum turcica Et28A]
MVTGVLDSTIPPCEWVKLHFSVSCLLRSIQLRVALRVFAVLARHGLAMEDD